MNTNKIEILTNWIIDQVQWLDDYQEHEDNINAYLDCFETYSLNYDEIDVDYRDIVKDLFSKLDASTILDLCDAPFYHHGFNKCNNEIWSIGIGEVEGDLAGIYDSNTGSHCVFTAM